MIDEILEDYVRQIHHEWAVPCGWWTDLETGEPIEKEFEECLALIHSELSEALEGHRKNLMDDKVPHRKMVEVELADAFIRVCDTAGGYKIQLYEVAVVNLTKRGVPYHISKLHYLLGKLFNAHRKDWRYHFSVFIAYLEAMCEEHDLDLHGAIEDKMEVNRTRADHKLENRKKEGGKKY